MGRATRASQLDASATWRNVPGYLYLNGDVVEEIRQLSGAGGKGTVDELGFQVLYDRIAERLFPWCSTLTSRARYFFFSLAVLDIALSEVIDDGLADPNRDSSEQEILAEQKRRPLMRAVRRLERALALSLVTKHETAERGIFGSLRCRRWFKDDAQASARGRILSSDARYPNAIYRGASRALDIFAPEDSSTTGLLRARLSGARVFDVGWHGHAKIAVAAVRQLDEFWTSAATRDLTFSEAAEELEGRPSFKIFGGFRLRPEEARFLYERIQHSTPYLDEVRLIELEQLVKSSELDLQKLKAAVSARIHHELFDAARHIDAVTTPFRGLYAACAENRVRAEKAKVAVDEVRSSQQWLDAKSKSSELEWAPIWSNDISPLINEWLGCISSNGTPGPLLDALCERAEQVVRGRGQGKQAPHEKKRRKQSESEKDAELKNELDVRETSFRIGNGTLILKDIVAGIGDR